MNEVQLIGRLTHDPEADRTAGGTSVATFRLAVHRPRDDSADFVTVKVWSGTADAVLRHLVRGRRVAVQGRLFHDEWTRADGQRAARLIVVASRVEFLDAPTGTVEDGSKDEDRGRQQDPCVAIGPPSSTTGGLHNLWKTDRTRRGRPATVSGRRE